MLETVRVKCPITEDNDQGFYVINKEDLTAEHELFGETKTEEAAVPVAPVWNKQ